MMPLLLLSVTAALVYFSQLLSSFQLNAHATEENDTPRDT